MRRPDGQPFRVAVGGLVDRTRPLRFEFDGKAYGGFLGDTLASALLANGVRLVGRSFKYHRPRGIMAAGVEETNALVQLGAGARSTPNVRATEIALYDGLQATPVNCWPSVRFDIGGVNDRLSRFLAAGFYYKTFIWPGWATYEWAIRRAAGIGKVGALPDPDRYESRFAHCDVLVIGAGPSGLAAARSAAATGARVLLVEQDTEVGGGLLWNPDQVDGQGGRAWAQASRAAIQAQPEARVLTRTTAVGYYDQNAVVLVEQVGDEAQCAAQPDLPRCRMWQVRAGRVILATGAIERPLVFGGNDRPGVMLSSAVRQYVNRYGVAPGRQAVVFTNDDDAYATAAALADAGVTVAAMLDLRPEVAPALAADLAARGIPLHRQAAVVATHGRKLLARLDARLADGSSLSFPCDLLAMSGGWNPTVHLFSQSGGRLAFDAARSIFLPDHSVQAECSVGMAAGRFELAAAVRQAAHQGSAQAAATGWGDPPAPMEAPDAPAEASPPVWSVPGARGKAFVDFHNDVTAADIDMAARESYRSVEHLKRYTTLGMAPDQGKTSNVNALAILSSVTGRTIAETGTTRYRPPFTPQPIGAYAGRTLGEFFRPLRRVPAHDRHVALGGLMEDYGGWLRPSHYPRAGESHALCEQREAATVRRAAGLFEASPLGKIEVKGPDAGRFLDRIYANTMSTLKVGKVRYGLMLSDAGVIIDDGVAARAADDHFIVATSSAGASRIALWLEEWRQCEWPDLQVVILPVTSAWAVATLTGPAARDILRAAGPQLDLEPQSFTHMSFQTGRLADIPARVFRVSYTGETSFEINVPASRGAELWETLMTAGAPLGLTPVGIEAWMILRMEKGYLHIGADTDGTTSALDVGWTHVLKRKADFIGKRSLLRSHDQSPSRLQFVGFEAVNSKTVLPIGAHVVAPAERGVQSGGYVTSSTFSPTLRRGVALGMLVAGHARLGETVTLRDAAGVYPARVVSPVAFDPDSERLHG